MQIAGNFPDTDGRMEMDIVKIQLGAFPYHLLPDVGDQHVGADGGCLPGWWLWGSVDKFGSRHTDELFRQKGFDVVV